MARHTLPLLLLLPTLLPSAFGAEVIEAQALGTSCTIHVVSGREGAAAECERVLQAEIDRLASIFSRWDADSELSRLNASPVGEWIDVSPELGRVLKHTDAWRRWVDGAFHPCTGELAAIWKRAAEAGELPEEAELAAAVQRIDAGERPYRVDEDEGERRRGEPREPSTYRVRRESDLPLDLDAIAKGTILDRAIQKAWDNVEGLEGLCLDIGGDLIVRGSSRRGTKSPWLVDVADPNEPEATLATVRLANLAIATSGGYARFREIGGKRYSHILDPRDGQPANGVRSATVVCYEAEDADALATMLCLLSPEEGLAKIARRRDAACLIVDGEGKEHRSPTWTLIEEEALADAASNPHWPADHRVRIAFRLVNSWETVNEEHQGRHRYKRHFVAAWVADERGRRVKLLTLWAKAGDIGYVRDLETFWRAGWTLAGHGDEPDDLRPLSRATRPPGRYTLVWDGTDDLGEPVPQGTYQIHLEVNREHGPPHGDEEPTHTVVTIACGTAAAEAKGEDHPELDRVRVTYGPRPADR